jgi:hypothetical protein
LAASELGRRRSARPAGCPRTMREVAGLYCICSGGIMRSTMTC